MTDALPPTQSLGEEIQQVRNTLSSGPELIQWKCSVDPAVSQEIPVPRSLVTGFVDHALNAITTGEQKAGSIEVSVHRTGPGVLVMVANDCHLHYHEYGTGQKEGRRLELLNHHIQVFNREMPHTIHYQILDIAYCEPGKKGTRVVISINL